jgi:hypothetical protein
MNFEIFKLIIIESGCDLLELIDQLAALCSAELCYLKKAVLPSPGGPLSRHVPPSSIATANRKAKHVLDAPDNVGRGKCGKYSI